MMHVRRLKPAVNAIAEVPARRKHRQWNWLAASSTGRSRFGALLLAGNAALEFGAAETAKGNAMMRAGLFFIAAVALWSFGRAILRALAGK